MNFRHSRIAEENFGREKLRVAIYARKSAEDERQTSLATQIEVCQRFISQYEIFALSKVYSEDNVSGMFTDNRTEYLAMLGAAERGEIDVVVVIRLDRLGRDLANTATAIKLLAAYGCTLIAGDDISDRTPVGEFMRGILLCQNEYHARITASRVMESEIHNVKKGDSSGGIAPYGLRIVNKRFELDDTEAPTVKRIFEMTERRKELQRHHRYPHTRGYQDSKRQKIQLFHAQYYATQRKVLRYISLQPKRRQEESKTCTNRGFRRGA